LYRQNCSGIPPTQSGFSNRYKVAFAGFESPRAYQFRHGGNTAKNFLCLRTNNTFETHFLYGQKLLCSQAAYYSQASRTVTKLPLLN
jgi:hypothetical protein